MLEKTTKRPSEEISGQDESWPCTAWLTESQSICSSSSTSSRSHTKMSSASFPSSSKSLADEANTTERPSSEMRGRNEGPLAPGIGGPPPGGPSVSSKAEGG